MRRDGRLIPTLLYTATEADRSGHVTGTRAMFVDITERKRAEAALRTSEAQLSNALTMAHLGHWEYDVAKDLFTFNDHFYKIFRTTAEQVGGYTMSSADYARRFVHPDDISVVGNEIRKSIEATDPHFSQQLEHRVLYADGEIGHITVRIFLVKDDLGHTVKTYGVNQDITERKRVEQALQDSEQMLKSLLAASPVGILFTQHSKIKWANDAWATMFGLENEGEYIDQQTGILYSSQEEYQRVRSTLYDNLAPGEVSEADARLKRKDGSAIDVHIRVNFLDPSDPAKGTISALSDVSDRKRSEEELQKSEERLELALQGADLGLWDLHVQTGQAVANQRSAEIAGYSLDEIEQNFGFWESLLHPDDHQRALEKVFNHLAGLTDNYEDEYRVRHKSGDWRWIFSRGKVTERDQDGKPLRMTGTYLDITDRKTFELRVAEANELREKIVSESPMGIAVYRAHGECISANEALGKLVGADRERLLTQNFLNLTSWQDSGLLADAELVLSEGINNQREVHFTSTFGRSVWVNARMARLTSGDELHLLVVFNDITERRMAEDALKESEQRYRSLFEESRDGVYSVLRDGEITDANPSFLGIFGYTKEEMIGKDIRQLYVDPADRPRFQEEIEKKGFVKDYKVNWKKKDGTEVDCLLTSSVHFGEDGNITGYRGILRDVTDQKQLQRQLFQAQKMESIGTLAGGIAHDFNNLLTVILGYSELIISEKEEGDKEYEDLTRIIHAGRTAGDMVQQILAFSRKTETKPRPINLNKQVEQLKKMLSRLIPKIIEVEITLDSGLPTVNADPAQIEQVLMNLAVNARGAMPNGGRLLIETQTVLLDEKYCRFHLEAAQGRHALLVVRDTGVGIDRTTMDRIFEPFYTTKGPGQGTGLGLAMVYGIVKSHGGHITCESEPGRGTAFRIYLPAHEVEGDTDVKTSGEFSALGEGTILLVDDEDFVRQLGQRILEKAGYTVITATNGLEAVEVYRERGNQISLVILDLIMPVMDGNQCLEEILRLDPTARVLIASGYSPDGTIRETLEGGTKRFVGKPYNLKQLLKTVRDALNEK